MEFTIRRASINDINELKELEKLCFNEQIRENFQFVLSSDNYIFLICEKVENNKKEVVGYVGASISYEQGDILSICVHENFRKKSIAFVLMDTLLEELKKSHVESVFLEVSECNIPAQNLYKKIGFIKINERKNYYGEKSAIIMQKKI